MRLIYTVRFTVLSLWVFCFSCTSVFAQQEVLVPLTHNPSIHAQQLDHSPRAKRDKRTLQKLPFFDDFSYNLLFPVDSLWLDRNVYISAGSSVNPPSTGTVVFDGIGANGRAYNPGDATTNSRPSDTLTSTYFDLSAHSGDSIYMSFFYEPQGYGDNPESGDSLILQFRADDGKWYHAWSTSGDAPLTFSQAMVNINAVPNNYLYDSFQFRFVNYGNHSGNLDNWFLDYIYINSGRWPADTSYEDVAIYYPPAAITKKYYRMPWKHFMANLSGNLADSVAIFARNNSSKVKNTAFGYSITDISTGLMLASVFNTQSDNLDPHSHRKFSIKTQLNAPPPANTGKVTLAIKTAVTNIPDDFLSNDTAFHYQVFDNYFAYDDGTPEAGYGLVGGSSGGKVAVQFTLDQPDTLYGVLVYFNQSDADVADKTVTMAVWNKKDNNPDKFPVEITEYVRPNYDAGINGFTYVEFDTPVYVSNQFYVGWTQETNFLLNVGFDRSYKQLYGIKNNSSIYTYLSGKWSQSIYEGNLMIRPVVGSRYVSVEEAKQDFEVNIFPNPSTGSFNFSGPAGQRFNASLYELTGREVMSFNMLSANAQLDCQHLPKGIYLLRIQSLTTDKMLTKKLIIK